jgi:hypothetical protein
MANVIDTYAKGTGIAYVDYTGAKIPW